MLTTSAIPGWCDLPGKDAIAPDWTADIGQRLRLYLCLLSGRSLLE
ncbi:hypothetical protein [uncultured Nostoc sp.]